MSVGRLPTAAHRPGGTPPSEGGVPPPRWAEPNYPSVINKPAATQPDASDNSMTEATSMTWTAFAILAIFEIAKMINNIVPSQIVTQEIF